MVARGGSLNFIGALANGLLQFAMVVVVTRALTRSASGAFFEAVALFLILSNTAELGADTGLTRMIPRYRVAGRVADVRRSLSVGLVPSFVGGVVLAAVSFALAGPLAEVFTNHRQATRRRGRHLHPRAGGVRAAVVGLHGGHRRDPWLRDDAAQRARRSHRQGGGADPRGGGRRAGRRAAASPSRSRGASRSGSRSRSRCSGSAIWCAAPSGARRPPSRPTPLRQLAREFWVFTAPRGMTGVFQVTTLWVGTLMVGLADGHRPRIDLHRLDAVPRRGQRGQHGHHPGDRAQALRAAGKRRPAAGDGRLPGGDRLARADGLADVPGPRDLRPAAAARVQAPVRRPGRRRSRSWPSRCWSRRASGRWTWCS